MMKQISYLLRLVSFSLYDLTDFSY